LNDDNTKVFQMALNALDEACDTPECLDTFVKCRPSLDLLTKYATSLYTAHSTAHHMLTDAIMIVTVSTEARIARRRV
jgi:hypothetical protein